MYHTTTKKLLIWTHHPQQSVHNAKEWLWLTSLSCGNYCRCAWRSSADVVYSNDKELILSVRAEVTNRIVHRDDTRYFTVGLICILGFVLYYIVLQLFCTCIRPCQTNRRCCDFWHSHICWRTRQCCENNVKLKLVYKLIITRCVVHTILKY